MNPSDDPIHLHGVSISSTDRFNSKENEHSEVNSEIPPPSYGTMVDDSSNSNDKKFIGDNSTAQKHSYKEEDFGFDLTFIKRFLRLNGLLFARNAFSASTGLFMFLICMVVLREYIVYQVGLVASGYYKSLGDKDLQGFWIQTYKSVLIILAVSFVNSTTVFVQKVITVTFRRLLSETAHKVYFADIHFYQLNVLDKDVDNPDQRMCQDIDKFCTIYCEALPKLLVSPFTIAYYCYQGYQRSGWQGPVGCFGFFIVATTINKLLMTPIVNYVVKQEKCEGDFRFLHMLVRVYSEPIAFHQAAILENGKVDLALRKLVYTQYSLYLRQYFLSYSVNFWNYMGSILSYLLLAIPIFSGEYDHLSPSDLSVLISQNAFILIYLIFTFTSLVELSVQFTDVAGVCHRVAQLFEKLSTLDKQSKNVYPDMGNGNICKDLNEWSDRRNLIKERMTASLSRSPISTSDQLASPHDGKKLVIWKLDNVTICPPNSDVPLVEKLDMEFVVGQSVLITGASSAGKTSLFRALRGIWPCREGELQSRFPPGPYGVYFSTQKSYLTWGTLKEQICFPLHPNTNNLNDELILHYLKKLKLTPILDRVKGLDVPCSWSVYDSLSPGEMQRLCILRIFYHQPVVAILDEATSALPLDMEEFIYSELRRLQITLISVGHRDSIRKYHDQQLIISLKGKWTLCDIHEKNS